jgi:hypothetical protein
MLFVLKTYYEKKQKGRFIAMSSVITFAQEAIDATKLDRFRCELLLLLKSIRNMQHDSKGDVITTAMDNYLKLTNVVDSEKEPTLGLNVLSCIQRFDEMGAYGDEDNICLDLNEIKLVQHELLQELSDTEFYKSTKRLSGKIHMSNQIQIHDYSIERYSIIPRSKLIIKKFIAKYKSQVLDDYWEDLSEEQKKQYSKEDWKLFLHHKTQYSIQLARKHILEHYIKQIKELQEKIIDKHAIVHKQRHVAPSKKYEELCSELRVLLDHIINRSTTHVADSIVTITEYEKDQYGCLIDAKKINLMGIKQSCFLEKITDRKFMEDNFTIEFMEELDTLFHPDGFCTNWICQGKNCTSDESSRSLVFTDLDGVISKYENGIVEPMNRKETIYQNKESVT